MHWIKGRSTSSRQNLVIQADNTQPASLLSIDTTDLLISILSIIGIFILIVDAKTAGYAWRYHADFSWAFCKAAVLTLFQSKTMTQMPNEEKPSLLRVALITSAAFSFLYQFFALFAINRYGSLIDISPSHYYSVADWFLFLP